MATEDVQEFRKTVLKSQSVQEEVGTILQKLVESGTNHPPKEGERFDLSLLVELAAKHGYTFTQEELRTSFYTQEESEVIAKKRMGDGELTDAELEAVSGGFLEDTFLANNPLISVNSDQNSLFNTGRGSEGSSETTRAW